MDFILNEDQAMLRDTVRRIAEEKFAPIAAEIDEKETFPKESVKVLAENGLLGVQIPEAYGGAGAGMLAMVLVVEEIARVCAATSVILTTQALASDPLLLAGTEDQKKNFLYRLASGACLGAC
ncbi:MAG TPA: acyl-CoA dehydrogenase family protein, partial [Syntrophales bacterium]|nr:acyl-CoA dehydrogenase family protein [Syntrophales bacterium]HQP29202.1 acyl-CoA dehydrogenase family protein [Syntrophales bacterium]